MLLTSTVFLIFILITAIFNYTIRPQYRWIVLLFSSIVFYCTFEWRALLFVLLSSLTVFVSAKCIELNADNKKKKKIILISTLCLNFGILAFVKYVSVPIVILGISFYTFQIIGYLLDIYWGRDNAEQNYFKLLLFTVYFPQMIQGPISRHKVLASQFEDVKFEFNNIKYGTQLMVWGFFKKIVIADTIATAANEVLHNPGKYTGYTVIIGILAYCAELYGDFSGGIDIVRGCSQVLGVHLTDNFKRPFFSQSIAEFWRRWHITLGTWMKDYVFYPMALSKSMNKLGKKCQKLFGRVVGRKIPMAIENIVVFLIVGIWHGASMHFVVYGLYNGLIIAFSTICEPLYDKFYLAIHIDKKSVFVRIFRTIRTFILVNIGWYFDDVSSLRDSIILIKSTFLNNTTHFDNSIYLGLFKYQYMYVVIGCIILLAVSIAQERGIEVRKKIDSFPFVFKMTIWLILIMLIPLMGWDPSAASGFMYANF